MISALEDGITDAQNAEVTAEDIRGRLYSFRNRQAGRSAVSSTVKLPERQRGFIVPIHDGGILAALNLAGLNVHAIHGQRNDARFGVRLNGYPRYHCVSYDGFAEQWRPDNRRLMTNMDETAFAAWSRR
jgi:hypothetical protein